MGPVLSPRRPFATPCAAFLLLALAFAAPARAECVAPGPASACASLDGDVLALSADVETTVVVGPTAPRVPETLPLSANATASVDTTTFLVLASVRVAADFLDQCGEAISYPSGSVGVDEDSIDYSYQALCFET